MEFSREWIDRSRKTVSLEFHNWALKEFPNGGSFIDFANNLIGRGEFAWLHELVIDTLNKHCKSKRKIVEFVSNIANDVLDRATVEYRSAALEALIHAITYAVGRKIHIETVRSAIQRAQEILQRKRSGNTTSGKVLYVALKAAETALRAQENRPWRDIDNSVNDVILEARHIYSPEKEFWKGIIAEIDQVI